MIIKSISVKRFGPLVNFKADFAPGLNVIKGPNESGKSTLHQAMLVALLERPRQIMSLSRHRTWGEDLYYELAIFFDFGDDGPWSLIKDFENGEMKLVNGSGDAYRSRGDIEKVIAQALGTTSTKVFRSTVCVEQGQLTNLSDGEKDIARSLEEIVTGGEDDIYTQAAIDKLKEKVQEYERGVKRVAYRNPGPIARLQAEHDTLEQQMRRYQTEVQDHEQTEEALRETAERLSKIEQQLNPMQAVRAQAERVRSLRDDLEKWSKKEDTLDKQLARINTAEMRLADARQDLDELKPMDEVTEKQNQSLAQLHSRVQTLREQKQRAEDAAQRTTAPPDSEPAKSKSKRLLAPRLIALSGLVILCLGIIVFTFTRSNSLAIIALLGLVILAVGMIRLRRSQPPTVISPPAMLSPVFDDTSLMAAENQLTQMLAMFHCVDLDDFQTKWAKVQQVKQTEMQSTTQLQSLLPAGESKKYLVEQRKAASRQRRDTKEALEDPEIQHIIEMDAIEIQQLQQNISDLETEQKELQERTQRLQGRAEIIRTSREDLLRTEEQLASINTDLKQANERLEIYQLALEVMTEAREKTLRKAQDDLGPQVGAYLEKLTLARYDTVGVNGNLNIVIKSPARPRGAIEPRELSKGTQDQLYLAARLALVGLLFPKANPPIFLDDPFVKFDPERRRAAIELCQLIAEERQVFLFTCSDDYDGIGHVIKMVPA